MTKIRGRHWPQQILSSSFEEERNPLRTTSLRALSLLCLVIAIPAPAGELKKPGPSPSDALFDPSRVIQIEIRLDPKDWAELRISHPVADKDANISVTEKGRVQALVRCEVRSPR